MNGENNKKALKSGLWYTAANFLMRSIGFITTPIFTRMLTHEEFGMYNNYTSWLTIITIFVTLNLESTFISARFDYDKKFDEYVLSTVALSTLSGTIWLLALNIFRSSAESFLNLNSVYINVMIVYLLFLPVVNLYQARERYYFEYKKSVIVSLVISFGTAAVSILLVLTMNNRLLGRIIGSAAPTIIVGIIIYTIIIKRGKKIRISYWKYALPICLPYIPHLLSLNILNSMDRVMIMRVCGAEDTALYSLAYNCGTIVTILVSSLNTAFSPWLGEKLNDERYSEIRVFTKKYIVLFVIFAIGIMLISPEILLILGGSSYISAKYVMTPVAMGCIMQFLYIFFVDIEQFKKHTIGMAIASAVAALTNYILNYIFIGLYGYTAAAYTTLAGYLVLLFIHMFIVKKIGYAFVYSYRFVFGTVIGCAIATICISMLYSCSDLIRWCVTVLYLLTLLYFAHRYKQQLFDVIKMFKKER